MTTKFLHAHLSDFVADLGQNRGDERFQGLLLITSWLILQQPLFCFRDEVNALSVCRFHFLLLHGPQFRSRDNIVDTEGEPEVG